ncbi:MAG: LpxL/LpxP family Kdo(2)-lipid IV(A) lauroyl/palmitoleoyl acyltransferase [gamma proteobacterium symbiont of Bathyaustriella thionipta]|nr:LpxL/LpxP family Kdo(2)-lipid IV(A) lauroyl/palmitoleoyl acyltransferase [gamma proteobacterium symbiont of Bathyaustriella thionipta]MCU7949281.1 LpxL/LpxP family Kdo(2)-lipid IV(A) lauroyl/palmitoleoyl acyltransferase [gamma proteobacterium symbiont of Bathyaustriella thionipta]MCU7954005.1 LpxL/LpxP family Kdo(2)-lipid IV(A) lauroyl/palmitoleoyl acyltransferase [gamma proteobacterium symbiont of Bathyaustriella thionipta]MCU7955884.1 LpxL/LpxP family Kdo(2)-lipid IV(A) lauroyl/palmitoleoyl
MSKQSFPWQDYLAPKFWPSWLGLAGMRILAVLPFRIQLLTGKIIGHLFYRIARYRREIAQTNIRLCFPELTPEKQEKLVRDHFHSIGITISETALSWWGSDKQLNKLLHIEGLEYLQAEIQKGNGAILLGAHYTTLEISGSLLSLVQAVAVTYQELRNPLFNQVMINARQRKFEPVISRHDIRSMIKVLRANKIVWFATDQDSGTKNTLFVPFFNQLAATQTASPRMAKITKAPVLPFISRRLDNARGYQITILPPLENFPGDDMEQDIIRTNQIIEAHVRKTPEQYLWIHRRFKTRPEGMPKLYRKKPRRAKKQ